MISACRIPPVPPHLIAATLDRFCRLPASARDHRSLPKHALASGATPYQAQLVTIRLLALHAVFHDARWRPYRSLMRFCSIDVARDIDWAVVAIIADAPMYADATFARDHFFTALLTRTGTLGRA